MYIKMTAILFHSSQNGCHQENRWQCMQESMWRKEGSYLRLVLTINWYSHFETQYRCFFKKMNYCCANTTQGLQALHRDPCTSIVTHALLIRAENGMALDVQQLTNRWWKYCICKQCNSVSCKEKLVENGQSWKLLYWVRKTRCVFSCRVIYSSFYVCIYVDLSVYRGHGIRKGPMRRGRKEALRKR